MLQQLNLYGLAFWGSIRCFYFFGLDPDFISSHSPLPHPPSSYWCCCCYSAPWPDSWLPPPVLVACFCCASVSLLSTHKLMMLTMTLQYSCPGSMTGQKVEVFGGEPEQRMANWNGNWRWISEANYWSHSSGDTRRLDVFVGRFCWRCSRNPQKNMVAKCQVSKLLFARWFNILNNKWQVTKTKSLNHIEFEFDWVWLWGVIALNGLSRLHPLWYK